MYVCIYIYMYKYICIVHTPIYTYIHIFICLYVNICMTYMHSLTSHINIHIYSVHVNISFNNWNTFDNA